MPVVHATFVIEKTYPHSVARVFSAFADPDMKAKWYSRAPGAADAGLDMDFRVGGRESMRYTMGKDTPFAGAILSAEGLYLDIMNDSRIVIGSNMAMNGQPFSGSLICFEFEDSDGGTRLTVTHDGAFFENADGPEMRENGWRVLLDRLGDAL
ncbi:MAG: SRPBCC domain-containing protein [Asticcacaulis sp.]